MTAEPYKHSDSVESVLGSSGEALRAALREMLEDTTEKTLRRLEHRKEMVERRQRQDARIATGRFRLGRRFAKWFENARDYRHVRA